MAIDARVKSVIVNEDGSGELKLVDRPGGIAGQSTLSFVEAPKNVKALEGLDVWGGSSFLMLGDIEIAKRIGYTRIKFKDEVTFEQALSLI